jgi:hypothetical protein
VNGHLDALRQRFNGHGESSAARLEALLALPPEAKATTEMCNLAFELRAESR